MSTLKIMSECGTIELTMRPDAAPLTVKYITELCNKRLYNNRTFYRRCAHR
jgi:cyclophilin family peptidyl-prolyl cis-trans isomerase